MEFRIRKPQRLPEYDYSQNGAYFITICTENRENIFWKSSSENHTDNRFELSKYGEIAERLLHEIPKRYVNTSIDKYVIMPNHIHLITRIDSGDEKDGRLVIAPTSISKIVQQYKSAFTKMAGIQIWQKSFYEHIIRNNKDYEDIWMYIQMNPEKWHKDKYNEFLMR